MIFRIVIQILTVTTLVTGHRENLLPDFYAVKRDDVLHGDVYRIYSKVRDCTAYQSGDRVLYQDGDLLKISTLRLSSGDLECQNIKSNVDSSKASYETIGQLPLEESDRTFNFTSSNLVMQGDWLFVSKITIEIEIVQKCEEKIGFKIFDWQGKHQEAVSREQCESRNYWNQKYPDQNLIFSFFDNKCNFDFINDVAYFVKEVQAKLFIHSSQCHEMKEKDENVQIENSTDEKTSSQNGNLIVICICTVVGFLIVALVIITICVKRRRAKESEEEVDEMNYIYGGGYYQDPDTEIVNQNDYYRK